MIFAAGDRSIDRSIARGPPNKSTQRERERERERKVYGFSPIHLIRVATADGRVSIVMAEVNCVCKKKKKKKHPSAVIGQVSRSLCRPLVFFFFFFYFFLFLFFFVFALSLFGGPLVVSKTCRGQRHGYANKALAWIVPKRRHSGAILALSASFASGTAKVIRR